MTVQAGIAGAVPATRPIATVPIGGFRRLTASATLLLAAPLAFFGFAVLRQVEPIMLALIALSLTFGALSAIRRRWSPLFGAAWGSLLFLAVWEIEAKVLFRTGGGAEFAAVASALFLSTVAAVSGLVATVQAYRRDARPVPGLLRTGLVGAVGVLAGAMLVQAMPATNVSAGVSREVLATLPAITAHDFAFDRKEVRVKAGETVAFRVENGDQIGHTFDIEELGVHVVMNGGSSNLALFKAGAPGSYTFYCLPHYDKATGEGMHGTLIVE